MRVLEQIREVDRMELEIYGTHPAGIVMGQEQFLTAVNEINMISPNFRQVMAWETLAHGSPTIMGLPVHVVRGSMPPNALVRDLSMPPIKEEKHAND